MNRVPLTGPGWLTGVCLVVLFVAGCETDQEYAQKSAHVRTDWTGREIVGIWVTKFHDGPRKLRISMLLRPDGTGQQIVRMPGHNHFKFNLTWHYQGGGLWEGAAKATSIFAPNFDFKAQYDGSSLLFATSNGNFLTKGSPANANMVLVRAEDETAVEEHLRNR